MIIAYLIIFLIVLFCCTFVTAQNEDDVGFRYFYRLIIVCFIWPISCVMVVAVMLARKMK